MQYTRFILVFSGIVFLSPLLGHAQFIPKSPFIPPGANVVILIGVPGDIENERAYNKHLEGLLEVIDRQTVKPRKVFILSDSQPKDAPASFPVEQFPAKREAFLNLCNRLQNEKSPLILIAIGHGGLQGSTPVFHVTGPRLEPRDFKALAESVSNQQSHWVLLFRGSSAFAEQIKGDNRFIISSEKKDIASGDPIGIALLLKILNQNPNVDFLGAAKSLGAETARWYHERSLAKSEDPTFWAESSPAESLFKEIDSSAEKDQEDSAQADAGVSKKEEKDQKNPDSKNGISKAWKGVEKIDPAKYPNEDAVILKRQVQYVLADNPAVSSEHDEFIQVLTSEGKKYGDFNISFHPPEEDITFQNCEVLRPDGSLIQLNPDDIHDAQQEEVADYKTVHQKIFSLPGVGPGVVLRVHYSQQWKKFPLPHTTLEVPLRSELPLLNLEVQTTVPKNSSFHFVSELKPSPDPVINQTAYGTTYAWRFHDLEPEKKEILSSLHRKTSLLISTFPDWASFQDWYNRLIRLSNEVTPEISAKALELTRDLKTDTEKIKAIYNFVTGLRYVSVPLGVNSMRPHSAVHVLQNQFGDCKDKANLFNALLQAVHIKSNLVLVPRFKQANDAIPGAFFNHAISCVSLDQEKLWVDTTDEFCRFGLLPPGDPGRKVLVIDGESKSLTQLPQPLAEAHQIKLDSSVVINSLSDDTHKSVIAVETLGYPDYQMRQAVSGLGEMKNNFPLLGTELRSAAGVFSLEKQIFTLASELNQNFEWKADGFWTGLAVSFPEENQYMFRAPYWIPKEWDVVLHRRSADLLMNDGYPLALKEKIIFKLPSGCEDIQLPGLKESKESPLSWKIEWSKINGETVEAHLTLQLTKAEIEPEKVKQFQEQIRKLMNAMASPLRFKAK